MMPGLALKISSSTPRIVVFDGHDVRDSSSQDGRISHAGAHDMPRNRRHDRHDELAILNGDAHFLQKLGGSFVHTYIFESLNRQPHTLGFHHDSVVQSELLENVFGEPDEIVGAGMPSYEDAFCPFCFTGNDLSFVTDTGKNGQSTITGVRPIAPLNGDVGLDVIGASPSIGRMR
jgi:hypothetical protein